MERRPIEIAEGVHVPAVWALAAGTALPQAPCVVLAPSAGANMDHPFMSYVQAALPALGIAAVKFNFPYQAAGRKAPDAPPRLMETWRMVLAAVRKELPGAALFPGGRSMGGRIASMVVAGGATAAGLALLGYPLQPAGRPDVTRAEHLPRIRCPVLFVQGTRDPLCDLRRLRPILQSMPAAVTLSVVEGGDHSFKVPRADGRSERQVWKEIVDTLGGWVARICSEGPRDSG